MDVSWNAIDDLKIIFLCYGQLIAEVVQQGGYAYARNPPI